MHVIEVELRAQDLSHTPAVSCMIHYGRHMFCISDGFLQVRKCTWEPQDKIPFYSKVRITFESPVSCHYPYLALIKSLSHYTECLQEIQEANNKMIPGTNDITVCHPFKTSELFAENLQTFRYAA